MPRGGRVDAAGPSNPRDAAATDAAVEGLMKEVGSLTSDAAATVVDEPTPVPDSTQAGSDIGGEAAEPPVLSEAGDSTGPTTPDAATTAETGDAPRVGPVADAGITTETGADAHTTSIVSGGAAPPPPAPSKAGVGAEATEVAAGGEGVVAQEQAKIGSSPCCGASPSPRVPPKPTTRAGRAMQPTARSGRPRLRSLGRSRHS